MERGEETGPFTQLLLLPHELREGFHGTLDVGGHEIKTGNGVNRFRAGADHQPFFKLPLLVFP
jgi:hypothetical protein